MGYSVHSTSTRQPVTFQGPWFLVSGNYFLSQVTLQREIDASLVYDAARCLEIAVHGAPVDSEAIDDNNVNNVCFSYHTYILRVTPNQPRHSAQAMEAADYQSLSTDTQTTHITTYLPTGIPKSVSQ